MSKEAVISISNIRSKTFSANASLAKVAPNPEQNVNPDPDISNSSQDIVGKNGKPVTVFINLDNGVRTNIADGRGLVIAVDTTGEEAFRRLFGSDPAAYNEWLRTYENSNCNLHLSVSDLNHLAGTIYAEASNSARWTEAAAIYGVLRNRATADKTTLVAKAQAGAGVYGANEKNKIFHKLASAEKVRAVYAGIAIAILAYRKDKTDFSNGAYYWHGNDFRIKDSNVYKDFYESGFNFTNPAHDQWGMGSRASGSKAFTYKYESTAFFGSTIFMKLTSAWMKNAGSKTRWDGSQQR